MTDVDPDDIAYIGNDEDIRGPGCLIILSGICSSLALIGAIASCIWLIISGAFNGGINAVLNAGLSGPFVFLVLALSVFAGGFGLGLGLYAAWNARYSERPHTATWGGITAVTGGVSALFAVAQFVALVLLIRGG